MENSTVLAVAHPNEGYLYYNNFRGVTLEARQVGNQVHYYEINNGTEYALTRDTVCHMFKPGYPITDQPFLVKPNKTFYAILYHQRAEFREQHFTRTRV